MYKHGETFGRWTGKRFTPRALGSPETPPRTSVVDDILHEAARLLWCLALFLFVAWLVLGSVGFWRAAFHA